MWGLLASFITEKSLEDTPIEHQKFTFDIFELVVVGPMIIFPFVKRK